VQLPDEKLARLQREMKKWDKIIIIIKNNKKLKKIKKKKSCMNRSG